MHLIPSLSETLCFVYCGISPLCSLSDRHLLTSNFLPKSMLQWHSHAAPGDLNENFFVVKTIAFSKNDHHNISHLHTLLRCDVDTPPIERWGLCLLPLIDLVSCNSLNSLIHSTGIFVVSFAFYCLQIKITSRLLFWIYW